MSSIQPSPPFSLAPHDWKSLAFGAAFAVVGALCGFATSTAIPTLQSHESSQFGVLIVTLLTAFIPWLLNFAKKYLTDTTTVAKLLAMAVGLTLLSTFPSCAAEPNVNRQARDVSLPAVRAALGTANSVAAAIESKNVFGDSTNDVLVISPKGIEVLTLDANGDKRFLPITNYFKQVVNLGTGPTPPVPPTPPSPITDRAKQIQAAASEVTGDSDRANTAKGLAELYRQIAKLVRGGQVADVSTLSTAMSFGADTFLNSRPSGTTAAWKPVRSVIGTQMTILAAKNPPSTMADYATLLDDVAAGLDASAPGKSMDPAILQLIMQIIQLVLQLLQPH